MARPRNDGQKRLRFVDEGGRELANVWALWSPGTATLLHDYPDFRPRPGVLVYGRGVAHRIAAVDGRRLTCEPLES